MLTFGRTSLDEVEILQRWHNMPSVKRWVPIENWKEYYQAVSGLENYQLYSVYREELLVAYIAAETENNVAAICLVVDPMHHHKGIGTTVLQEMMRSTSELFGEITAYSAGIFPGNIASVRCFLKAGFSMTAKGRDGEEIYTYTVRRE